MRKTRPNTWCRLRHVEQLEPRRLLAFDLTVIDATVTNADVAPSQLTVFPGSATLNGALYFSDTDPRHGRELHAVNLETGTRTRFDINPGFDDSHPFRITAAGDWLVFYALDPLRGGELRWIDTSAEPQSVQTLDVRPGIGESKAGRYGFGVVDDYLFFSATGSSGQFAELHWLDMAAAKPTLHTIPAWTVPGFTGGFTTVGQRLFFAADDADHGIELRSIDTSTVPFTLNTFDINPGPEDSLPGEDTGFVQFGSQLFFAATDINGTELRWIDLESPSPTVETLELVAGPESSWVSQLTVAGKRMFFNARETSSTPTQLNWIDQIDGVPVVHAVSGTSGSPPSELVFHRDRLYASSDNAASLQWLDPAAISPSFQPITETAAVDTLTSIGDRLYFFADAGTERRLHWLDTSESTPTLWDMQLTPDLDEASALRTGEETLFILTQVPGSIQFTWFETTTNEPTPQSVKTYPTSGSSLPGHAKSDMQVIGNQLFFTAKDPAHGEELRWIELDEQFPQVHVIDVLPGEQGAFDQGQGRLQAVGDRLFFTSGSNPHQLGWIDTQQDPTTINYVWASVAWDRGMALVDHKLYFANRFGRLFWIDAFAQDPVVHWTGVDVLDIHGEFLVRGNQLYFAASDDQYGHELRWIDTTDPNPLLQTLDLVPGAGDSFAGQHGGYTVWDDRLFFNAYDPARGFELRWIELHAPTSVIHTIDVLAGPADSMAGQLGGFVGTASGLFFSADNGSKVTLHLLTSIGTTNAIRDFEAPVLSDLSYPYDPVDTDILVVDQRLFFPSDQLRWIELDGVPELKTVEINNECDSNAGTAGGFEILDDRLFFSALQHLYWVDPFIDEPIARRIHVASDYPSNHFQTPCDYFTDGPYVGGDGELKTIGSSLFFSADKPSFGIELISLRVAAPDPDLNRNGVVDVHDLDLLNTQIAEGYELDHYDLNSDGAVDLLDRDAWLALAAASIPGANQPYLLGDANLDGQVDGNDFILWNRHRWTESNQWSEGDFNADGLVDGRDYVIWNDHKFQSIFAGMVGPALPGELATNAGDAPNDAGPIERSDREVVGKTGRVQDAVPTVAFPMTRVDFSLGGGLPGRPKMADDSIAEALAMFATWTREDAFEARWFRSVDEVKPSWAGGLIGRGVSGWRAEKGRCDQPALGP